LKKNIALTLMLMMLMMLVSTVGFAAKSSGSRSFSAPSKSSTSTPSGSYKPSAPASGYSNTAPAKQTTPSNLQNTQSQSSTGGFWRNASMIGGGMLFGSMLGNMFGMGGQSGIFGMLINLLMVGGVVMGIRYLWNKYKSRDQDRRMK